MNANKHKMIGSIGENIAIMYLQKQNYEIIARNWRYKHYEVDIIAKNNDILIFIEVKTRLSTIYGNPEEAVNEIKINNLINAAEQYIYDNSYNGEIRFDIFSILFDEISKKYNVKHIKDAFF